MRVRIEELVTEEVFAELEEAMKRGEIHTIAQAHRFLSITVKTDAER